MFSTFDYLPIIWKSVYFVCWSYLHPDAHEIRKGYGGPLLDPSGPDWAARTIRTGPPAGREGTAGRLPDAAESPSEVNQL